MSTIAQALAYAATLLREAAASQPALDAGVLLGHVLGKTRAQLLASPDETVSEEALTRFHAVAARRAKKEPIAYITGKKEFWSLDFCVTYDTLIPRPDSETLVEAALKRVSENVADTQQAKPITLLDIGTGTGCLLITLLKELPGSWGIGVDNNARTLKVAHENAKRHNVIARSQFLCGHWCDALHGKFDLILSNPPYIPGADAQHLMSDVRDYEPYAALVSGEDGLECYRAIASQVSGLLSDNGFALLEVGAGQSGDVAELMSSAGLTVDGIAKDMAGIERCVIVKRPSHH